MGTYSKFYRDWWLDKRFTALSMQQQYLYLLLLSFPGITVCGITPLIVSRWESACSDGEQIDFKANLLVLIDRGYVVTDTKTSELIVVDFIRIDGSATSDSRTTGVLTSIERALSPSLRKIAARQLRQAKAALRPGAKRSSGRRSGTPKGGANEGVIEGSSEGVIGGSSEGVIEGSSEGASEGSSEGASELKQQATRNKSKSKQQQAAAALDLYIRQKLEAPQVKNRSAYEHQLRSNLPSEWGDRLLAYLDVHPRADARELAREVLGVPLASEPDPTRSLAAARNYGAAVAAAHREVSGGIDLQSFLDEIMDHPAEWQKAAIAAYSDGFPPAVPVADT